MLRNPFCFVLQVVAVLLQTEPSSCGCSPAAPRSNEILGAYPMSSTRAGDICLVEDSSPPTIITASMRTASTSYHMTRFPAIKGQTTPTFTSGHGSSLSGNMLRNPFCFVLQVVAVLLQTEPSSCGCSPAAPRSNEILGAYPMSSTRAGDICLVEDSSPPTIITASMRTASTSYHMTRFPAIKGQTTPTFTSGHGSSLSGNMLRNPFCFVLQVVAVLLQTEPSSCGCSPAAPRSNEILGAYPMSSTRAGDICLVEDSSPPTIITASMRTASTSYHMTRFPAIKGQTTPTFTSGHGSSLSGNMLRNPFCFVLQVVAVLLQTEPSSCGCSPAAPRSNEILGAYPMSSTRAGDICLVEDSSPPTIITASMRTASTSYHMTRFPAIKGQTTPSFTSGHGSSLSGNMLRNPFCFVLQVVAVLLQTEPSSCGCSPAAPRSNEILGAYPMSSTRAGDICLVEDSSPPTIITASMRTASTSYHMTRFPAIKGQTTPTFTSGHGSSLSGNMLRNPFCFVLQVVAVLLQTEPSSCGCSPAAPRSNEILGAYPMSSTRAGDICLVEDSSPPTIITASMRTASTSYHMTRFPAIKGQTTPSFTSGHGSSLSGNMLRNPFCFVLQVLV
ncbi:uncharacterized protein [Dermacentor albipictus]|uniref:uncharacterized protein isoform X2 n=1 Tax=Dermacentor albipictus TaxID=60249 RepID=UPI0038FBEB2E